jgi:hypothetical protein
MARGSPPAREARFGVVGYSQLANLAPWMFTTLDEAQHVADSHLDTDVWVLFREASNGQRSLLAEVCFPAWELLVELAKLDRSAWHRRLAANRDSMGPSAIQPYVDRVLNSADWELPVAEAVHRKAARAVDEWRGRVQSQLGV